MASASLINPAHALAGSLQDGVIDVQDEGSQLIARLVAPKRREMVCDSAPVAGGKTLAIALSMRSGGSLYAFDVNEKRLQGMVPRLRRSGLTSASDRDPR